MSHNSSRLRLSEVDAPHPPTPPSPTLIASQSWASGEIPIFLEPSTSHATIQLSAAGSTSSSLFPPTGSVGTFGQPVRLSSRCSSGNQSRLSWVSFHDGDSESSGSSSSSFSVQEYEYEDFYGADQKSIFSLSAYLGSTPLHDNTTSEGSRPPLITQQNELVDGRTSRISLLPIRKRERPKTLSDLAHSDQPMLQSSRGLNLDLRAQSDLDVPVSPATSSLLLSPVSSAASELVTHSVMDVCPQHLRAVSAPVDPSCLEKTLGSYNSQFHPCLCPPLAARPRSNSNPQVPTANSLNLSHLKVTSVPEYLRDMRIDLWIDQEGFRAIKARFELASFSYGAGVNAMGETLDVAEFAMRVRQTWHFHYAPLDSAPVLRRLTINGDLNDYMSRQAALSLKENGVYAVESTEDKGRVAWKFEYRVEDRFALDSGKLMDGEKRFTPLRFVCNPMLLSAEHGKKIKLLQFVRKSVTPKLQSVLLCSGTKATPAVPRNVVRDGRASGETVLDEQSSNKSNGEDAAIEQLLTANGRDKPSNIVNRPVGSVGGQHIMSPSALNAMVAVPIAEAVVSSEGLPPPPRGAKRHI